MNFMRPVLLLLLSFLLTVKLYTLHFPTENKDPDFQAKLMILFSVKNEVYLILQ